MMGTAYEQDIERAGFTSRESQVITTSDGERRNE
jgi:hypothetical protein